MGHTLDAVEDEKGLHRSATRSADVEMNGAPVMSIACSAGSRRRCAEPIEGLPRHFTQQQTGERPDLAAEDQVQAGAVPLSAAGSEDRSS